MDAPREGNTDHNEELKRRSAAAEDEGSPDDSQDSSRRSRRKKPRVEYTEMDVDQLTHISENESDQGRAKVETPPPSFSPGIAGNGNSQNGSAAKESEPDLPEEENENDDPTGLEGKA